MKQVLNYFTEVLGVREILVAPHVLTQKPRVVFINANNELSQEALELLTKMIAAMKLELKETKILQVELDAISSELSLLEAAELIVSFSKPAAHFLKNNFPRIQVLEIPSPEEMLKNSSLKREAWETLKLGMKILEIQ